MYSPHPACAGRCKARTQPTPRLQRLLFTGNTFARFKLTTCRQHLGCSPETGACSQPECTLSFHGFLEVQGAHPWSHSLQRADLHTAGRAHCASPSLSLKLILFVAGRLQQSGLPWTLLYRHGTGPLTGTIPVSDKPTSPLFVLSSGLPLSRPAFTQQVQGAVTAAGVDNSSQYLSHSFYTGAATAAQSGIPTCLIKNMGRWSSEARQVYIHPCLATRLTVTQRLTFTS